MLIRLQATALSSLGSQLRTELLQSTINLRAKSNNTFLCLVAIIAASDSTYFLEYFL